MLTHQLIHSSTHQLIISSTHQLINSSTHQLISSSTHQLIKVLFYEGALGSTEIGVGVLPGLWRDAGQRPMNFSLWYLTDLLQLTDIVFQIAKDFSNDYLIVRKKKKVFIVTY